MIDRGVTAGQRIAALGMEEASLGLDPLGAGTAGSGPTKLAPRGVRDEKEVASMAESRGDSAVGVLRRSAELLRCFDEAHLTLSLSDLVRLTGLPKSTVHRLLQAMTEARWLEHVGTDYRVGYRLFELGSLSPLAQGLREIAIPYMQDLFASTHETVQLGVTSGCDVLYVEKVRGHRDITGLSRVGRRMPLYCTGIGKALLAYGGQGVLDAVLAGPRQARTSHTITDAEELRREVAGIRERGYAIDGEEAVLGIGCVAAPIVVRNRPAIAALSVSVPIAKRHQFPQLAPAVRMAAFAIARRAGSAVSPVAGS